MAHKKHRKYSIGIVSEQTITRHGLKICQKGGQIKILTENSWDVASQSMKGAWYRVSFTGDAPTCECPYHTMGGGRRCKHIAAIEHILLISKELSHDKRITIEKPEVQCPNCNSKEYTLDGPSGKHVKQQKYKCRICGRQFRDNLGMAHQQMPLAHIILILTLSGSGLSVDGIQLAFNSLGTIMHVDTITRILEYVRDVQ